MILNGDEIYLVCMKLDIPSLLKFSLCNKKIYEKSVNVLLYKSSELDKTILNTKDIINIRYRLNVLCIKMSARRIINLIKNQKLI